MAPSPSDAAAAKALTKEQITKLESGLRVTATAAFEWFKDQKEAMTKLLESGDSTYERYFVVINDPAREAIAVKLATAIHPVSRKAGPVASAPAEAKKGGLFGRLFGKR